QPLTNEARDDVSTAAWGKSDDDPHGPRRVSLCPCDLRHRRQRGGARGEMQEFAARKLQIRHVDAFPQRLQSAFSKVMRPTGGTWLHLYDPGFRHVPMAARVSGYRSFTTSERARTGRLCAHRTPAATSAFPTLLG